MNEPRYGVWLETYDNQQGYLKLDSDGIVQLTDNFFDAKKMPSKGHAIQLAKAVLNISKYSWIEIVIGIVDCDVKLCLWDGEHLKDE